MSPFTAVSAGLAGLVVSLITAVQLTDYWMLPEIAMILLVRYLVTHMPEVERAEKRELEKASLSLQIRLWLIALPFVLGSASQRLITLFLPVTFGGWGGGLLFVYWLSFAFSGPITNRFAKDDRKTVRVCLVGLAGCSFLLSTVDQRGFIPLGFFICTVLGVIIRRFIGATSSELRETADPYQGQATSITQLAGQLGFIVAGGSFGIVTSSTLYWVAFSGVCLLVFVLMMWVDHKWKKRD
ncbi:hypothetical protein [Seinonella peptonophila]|nr:hypothetical protein [Seinonella peptonophila]